MNESHVPRPAQGAEAGDTSLATRLRPGVPTGQGQLTGFTERIRWLGLVEE